MARHFKIPTSIYSPDLLRTCINELEDYGRALKDGKELPRLALETKEALGQLKKTNNLDHAAVQKLVEELEEQEANAKVVHITLAADPPNRLIREITEWFRDHITPNTLLVFHVHPEIIGGLVVRTLNKVHDWSYRTQLEKHYRKIPRIIHHV